MQEYDMFNPDTLYIVDSRHGLYAKINELTSVTVEHHLNDSFSRNGKTISIDSIDKGPLDLKSFKPEISSDEFESILLEGGGNDGET